MSLDPSVVEPFTPAEIAARLKKAISEAEPWSEGEPVQLPSTPFTEYTELAARLIGVEEIPPANYSLWDDDARLDRPGGLCDADEEALCTAVCNNAPGITAAEWRALRMEQRAPWMRTALANLNPLVESHVELTDNDYTILRALRDNWPRCVQIPDLQADTGIGSSAKGVVQSLIKRGLADRPRGPRGGASITSLGKAALTAADSRPGP